MGTALPDTEPSGRSKLASAAFTAIGLAFFFGVGLAGGGAYKIYFSDDGGAPVADKVNPAPAATPAPPAQDDAANAPNATESAQAAPDPAPVEASGPPAAASQAAPAVAEQPELPPAPTESTEPAMMAQAAAPPAPAAPESAPQAAPTEPQAVTGAAIAPAQPDSEAAMQAAAPPPATAIPPKPTTAMKAHRPAPQTAALHPPAAQSSTAGHFHVQFGAFANEDNARRVQWAVEATGLKVEVRHEPSPSGNPLFFVRSPSYPDRAAAASAAQAAQNRAQHLANPIRIDYAIIPDRAAAPEQHAQR